ncbi:MAG TPA: aminotransferase class I/II-fold pyridoxal phosphate-dependent enzyme [Jatrophihabitantaceae bacterium]|jgi:aspartate/methionine/tyrosine aminotransferase
MTASPADLPPAENARLLRSHIPGRRTGRATSVRGADVGLGLTGGSPDLLDVTHFDNTRFPAPEWAAECLAAAARDGSLAYTPYRGHPAVLDVLSESVSKLMGVPVDRPNLLLTPGSQAALFCTMTALIDEGDLVMVADPDYLFVERMLAFAGAQVERIPVLAGSESSSLDLDAVDRLLPQKPKLLVFSNPNNPTGAVYDAATLQGIADRAVAGPFRVLVDQLYCRLVYPGVEYQHLAAVEGMADRCITVLGPSKTESLTGYRIGVLNGPADVMSAVEQTLTLSALRAPAYAQQLLKRWLVDDVEFVANRIAELDKLRQLTVSALLEVPGLRLMPGQGTAYVFPDVSALGRTDEQIAAALQRQARVVISPGYQFGPRGVGHFRACYARDEGQWSEALALMVDCLRGFSTS